MALIPGSFTEWWDMGGDDDLRILLCRRGQDAFQVSGRFVEQGFEHAAQRRLVQRVMVPPMFHGERLSGPAPKMGLGTLS
jgi:hypothetical protein